MHESPADIAALQELLDRSYAAAGRHLLSIHTPERRLSAEQVVERMTGMRLLALATVTADRSDHRSMESSSAARSTSAPRSTRLASATSARARR